MVPVSLKSASNAGVPSSALLLLRFGVLQIADDDITDDLLLVGLETVGEVSSRWKVESHDSVVQLEPSGIPHTLA